VKINDEKRAQVPSPRRKNSSTRQSRVRHYKKYSSIPNKKAQNSNTPRINNNNNNNLNRLKRQLPIIVDKKKHRVAIPLDKINQQHENQLLYPKNQQENLEKPTNQQK
jgi:hypothetical protein